MKKIITLLLLIGTALQVYPQKCKVKKDTITSISFESYSRRERNEITINKDSAISTTRTDRKSISITQKKWNELLGSLNKLTLSSIPTYPAPTDLRKVDAAMHSKITVTTKTNKYESQYFDYGKPMKQLSAIYKNISAIQNEINAGYKK